MSDISDTEKLDALERIRIGLDFLEMFVDKKGKLNVTAMREKFEQYEARIASLEAENQRLRAVIDDMATDPMGEYHTGLRCGVEDRDIACRYEAAEYGWEQAFEYIGSIATSALLGGGDENASR